MNKQNSWKRSTDRKKGLDRTLPVASRAKRVVGVTKAEKRLEVRISDYEKTIAGIKGNTNGYHKPGSLQL